MARVARDVGVNSGGRHRFVQRQPAGRHEAVNRLGRDRLTIEATLKRVSVVAGNPAPVLRRPWSRRCARRE
jgi:hypothetical protein